MERVRKMSTLTFDNETNLRDVIVFLMNSLKSALGNAYWSVADNRAQLKLCEDKGYESVEPLCSYFLEFPVSDMETKEIYLLPVKKGNMYHVCLASENASSFFPLMPVDEPLNEAMAEVLENLGVLHGAILRVLRNN